MDIVKLPKTQTSTTCNRVDALVMRQLKIDRFKIIALKLQAVTHNTTRLIIAGSTLLVLIHFFA